MTSRVFNPRENALNLLCTTNMKRQSTIVTPFFQHDEENSFADNFVDDTTNSDYAIQSTGHAQKISICTINDDCPAINSDSDHAGLSGDSCLRQSVSEHLFELSINCGDDTYTNAILSSVTPPSETPMLQIQTSITNKNPYNEVSRAASNDTVFDTSNECRFSIGCATSPNKTNEKVCRICLDSEDQGDLIAPCKCSGSTKYAHERCLLQWFFKSSNRKCEVCLGNVNVKPMGYKPVQEWRLPERSCDFIVYLFGLYFVIMVIFTGMITWIATQRCASPVCITLYSVCAVAFIYFFYCCGCVEYSRRYWRSLVSVNRIWRIYGREDSHKGIKVTPKISKKHFVTPIQTSETIRSNVEPFVININSERGNNAPAPRLLVPAQGNHSTGTINPISVTEDEQDQMS